MLVFSDIIDIVLIIYVWCCLYIRGGIDENTRTAYFRAGIPLIAILVLDQCWQMIFMSFAFPNLTQRFLLTVLTSVCYMLVPFIYINFLAMGRKRWDNWRRVLAGLFFFVYVILPAVNIRYHILFYHNKNLDMVVKPLSIIMSIGEVIYFACLLLDFCRVNFPVDRQDHVLVTFVIVIVSLGQMAELMEIDLSTTWDSITLAYLLMYLSVKNLYEKTDIVTGLANRSSYLEYLRRPQFGGKKVQSIVVFDMNQLKHYNDTKGHKCGDAYLYAFAQTVRKALMGYGRLYRTGGDEFVFVSDQKTEKIQPVLDELQKTPRCDAEFGDFPMDFAYGLVQMEKGERVEEAVVRADHEMYVMKRKMHQMSRDKNDR
ncbi:MAG: GGDEF domain-containing protein [Eubacterium sp.]